MKEIIKHSTDVRDGIKIYKFTCECNCMFIMDSAELLKEQDSTVYYRLKTRCPECSAIVTKVMIIDE